MRAPTLGMTCTLVRVTQQAVEGDLTETETSEQSACAIFPKTWTEGSGRTVVETDTFDAYFPAGVDLTAVDRVRFHDDTLEVVGRPVVWRHPHTEQPVYVQATLRRSE